MGDHQASEGRGRREALGSVLQTHACHHGGGQDRRRPEPREQRRAGGCDSQGQVVLAPKGQDRGGHREGLRCRRDANAFEEVVYEGYGPAGVALYVEALTDNRNRTAADVRAAFTRAGGNLGATGSVAFQFERKGEITVDAEGAPDEDELLLLVADAGGDDLERIEEGFVVYTSPADVMAVKAALEESGVPVRGAELVMEPMTPLAVSVDDARKVLRLVDRLEELDDIQAVYHTMELTGEIAAALEE